MAEPHSKQPSEGYSEVSTSLEEPIAEQVEPIVADDPLDGGLTAWLQVLAVHLAMFNVLGNINCYLEYQSYYAETLGASSSAVSWVRYLHLFSILAMGVSTDEPNSHIKFRYAAGTLLLVLGIFGTSLATAYWQLFLSQGIFVGIANGLLLYNPYVLIPNYFEKKELPATLSALSGMSIGEIVLPLVIKILLPRIGFAWAIRAVGLITAVTMLGSNSILKPRTVGGNV